MNPNRISTWRRGRHLQPGFNMLEILLAMGIFTIGFVSVAAIFPAAIFMQKQSIDAGQGENLEQVVKAMVATHPYLINQGNYPINNGPGNSWAVWRDDTPLVNCHRDIRPHPDMNDASSGNLASFWLRRDRGYPSYILDDAQRKYYWVPLFRCSQNVAPQFSAHGDWEMYIFIMQRDGKQTWPRVADPTTLADLMQFKYGNNDDGTTVPYISSVGINGTINPAYPSTFPGPANFNVGGSQIRGGDTVLDNNGVTYTVQSVTDSSVTMQTSILNSSGVRRLWYVPPPDEKPDAPSPLLRIVTITTGGVKLP